MNFKDLLQANITETMGKPKVIGNNLVYEKTTTGTISKVILEKQKKILEAQLEDINTKLKMFK